MVAGYSATPKKEFYDRVPTGKQFGVLGEGYDERIAPEPSPSTSISSQFPSYKYESPLTPGMTPEDMARRSAMMNQIEQEIRDINRLGAYERTGDPLMAGGVPTGGRSPGKTRGFSITSPAEAATPEPEEKILEVEDFYRGRPTWAAETYASPYDAPSTANKTKQFGDRLVTINGVTKEVTPEQMNKMTPEDQKKLADSLQASTYTPPKELRSAAGTYFAPEKTETDFMNSGIESSGEIVRDGEFGYPTNADGSPITAEDIANMPEDIQREYFDKVRYSRNYDTPYPLTSAQKQKGYVAGGIGSILNRGLAGVGLKLASVVPGEFGEAAKKLSNVRKTVNEYDRLDPLKKQQMRERSGKGRGFGGGATSFTSPGGGKEDIGSGGKNEPIQVKQAEKESTKPKPKANEGGKRPAIYYKWDLGVSVPSPTDSDYTLYLKYLQEKAAAKAAVA
jgi:hypothetical protein